MCDYSPKWLVLVLIFIQLKCSEAKFELINLDFFEEVKRDFFLQTKFDSSQNQECSIQLGAIRDGLKKFEPWALKTVDAWGKFPSGIFSGNFYEFGAFSQCFDIVRDDNKFNTKYCLGTLMVDLKGILTLKNSVNHAQYNFFEVANEPGIESRDSSTSTGAAFTVGMCLPSSCATNLVVSFMNELINERVSNVSIKISDTTCQYQENATELKTIDIATIVLLAIVFCLIVISTGYDVLQTILNREKSQALLAFSFYSNGMKLLSYEKSKSTDTMHCLHGIRAISTQWIVLCHTFMMYLTLPIRNKLAFPEFLSKYPNMLVASGTIAVDTFFFMSGLLVSINMLKRLRKTNGKINIPLMYFHRYLRLTPLLGASFLVSMSLMRFLGNGPIWPNLIDSMSERCERNWWSALLYVQNYVNPLDICFDHSWYLSVDMQLFFISPIIIYAIYWFGAIVLPVLVLLVFGCVGWTIYVFSEYDLRSNQGRADKAYYPTHIRFSPWLIGVIAGYLFLVAKKRKIRIPTLLNIFCWEISRAIMAAVVFMNYPLLQLNTEATPLQFGLYNGLSRVAWSISLSYIIFACINNQGGPFNWFLSHPLWQPISRLCYAIYLVHYPVVVIMAASMKVTPYFTELTAFQAFLGNYIIIFFVAIIASLAFESPIVIIEKLIFGPRKSTDRRNAENTNNV